MTNFTAACKRLPLVCLLADQVWLNRRVAMRQPAENQPLEVSKSAVKRGKAIF